MPETLPRFLGTYWGAVSTAFCAEIVESADAYLFAGPIFNDYSSVGYSFLLNKDKAVVVQPDRVTVGSGPTFGCVMMKDFLAALAKRVRANTTAYDNYRRIFVPDGQPPECQPGEPLHVNVLFKHIQRMLTGDSAVIAETGDSWFNCQKLRLPQGCGYEFQMQYGSIGWSVGALLGYAQGAPDKRVVACIGDGSFQVTAQDVSTMLRCDQRSIIFLINNGGYTIEVEIHDGPYNVIKKGRAHGSHRHGHRRPQERLPLLHRGGGAQGRHQQGAPRMGIQGLRCKLQATQPAVETNISFRHACVHMHVSSSSSS